MTTLPSFVELMTTLGIDTKDSQSSQPTSSSSSQPSSPRTERLSLPASSPTRSRSSPSLRDQATRSRIARYTPYSPTLNPSSRSTRRGSVSSVSSSSSEMSQRAGSPRPSSSPRFRRRKSTSNRLTINVFGSSTDLAANTPISSYVRRKTPVTSPTSPTFSRESSEPPSYPMPFTLPTLPTFLPQSSGSDSFPITPESEMEEFPVRPTSSSSAKDLLSEEPSTVGSSPRFHTGIRISTSPRSSNATQYSKHPVVQVA